MSLVWCGCVWFGMDEFDLVWLISFWCGLGWFGVVEFEFVLVRFFAWFINKR